MRMDFFYAEGKVRIGNTTGDLSLFQQLEPSFRPFAKVIHYAHGRLYTSTGKKSRILNGWSVGDRYISREKEFRRLVEEDALDTNRTEFEIMQ